MCLLKIFCLSVVLLLVSVSCMPYVERDGNTIVYHNAAASLYLDEDVIPKPTRSHKNVRLFLSPSKHRCLRLGVVEARGNGLASFDSCVAVAKRKAAEVGADFIVLSDRGVSKELSYTSEIVRPWAHFTAWVYLDPQSNN